MDETPVVVDGLTTFPSYPDLAGKVAVVTGGSGGTGATTCRLLAANGARVAVNGRDRAAIDTVVDGIRRDGGQALAIAADCTDLTALERMRHRVEAELGPVEIVAAFVGGGQARLAPTVQLTEREWHCVVDGNLTATFLTLKSFLPGMTERHRGSIITMATTAARPPVDATAAYAAATAGVVMLTRHVAREVGPHGIRVNCVARSAVRTQRSRQVMSEDTPQRVPMHPLARPSEPEDVALATLFLASDSSSWITGITVDIASGWIML